MITTRIGTDKDIPGVLALQERYLFRNLNEVERQKGFVTTPFTPHQIEVILKQNGLFIAENETNAIVGYAFAGSWTYFKQWDIFNVMISRFPQLNFRAKTITTYNSFQYGPICIEESYRGTGLFQKLFEVMRIEFSKRYPLSITFINAVNVVSERAHTQKLGWEIIDTFEFNHNNYIALAFNMTHSVL